MVKTDKNYYELKVMRMDTDTYPLTNESERLQGIEVGTLSADDEAELCKNYYYTGGNSIEMSVVDNGPQGDGEIWLTFYASTKLSKLPDESILSIRLTGEQAEVLGKTLTVMSDLHKI